MALAKPVAFKGTTLGYHKIGEIRASYISVPPSTTVGLLSYMSKEARDEDMGNNLQGSYVGLAGVPPGDPSPADARAWAYEQIVKQNADWADATQV